MLLIEALERFSPGSNRHHVVSALGQLDGQASDHIAKSTSLQRTRAERYRWH